MSCFLVPTTTRKGVGVTIARFFYHHTDTHLNSLLLHHLGLPGVTKPELVCLQAWHSLPWLCSAVWSWHTAWAGCASGSSGSALAPTGPGGWPLLLSLGNELCFQAAVATKNKPQCEGTVAKGVSVHAACAHPHLGSVPTVAAGCAVMTPPGGAVRSSCCDTTMSGNPYHHVHTHGYYLEGTGLFLLEPSKCSCAPAATTAASHQASTSTSTAVVKVVRHIILWRRKRDKSHRVKPLSQ